MAIELGAAYISILPSTDKIAPEVKKALSGVEDDARKSGKESGDEFGSGFKDSMKAGLAVGAGLLVGAGLTKGFADALDQGNMNAKLSAQLGLSAKESGRFGKVAGDLFAGNYGESMDEVNAALRSVVLNIGGMRNASDSALTDVSAKVLNTAGVFDQDLGAVTRAVGQLMKTGLAKNADEALDVITVGFQKGADKSEDFLDTLNEYGTQFRKLGIDGKTATGLISQGLRAGARDGDIVADALKEFSIRAIDGSTASAAGYKALGLSAEKMTAQIAQGGPKASAGLQTVLARLRGMKDPVKQSAAAVALFGTQAEDMGKALFALKPEKAVQGLGKVAGAADKANKQMGETPAAQWSSFTRTLQQGFVRVMGGKVIPAITDAVGWLKKNKDTIKAVAVVLAPLVAGLLAYNTYVKVSAAVTKGWAIAQGLLNTAMALNPVGLVIAAIVALGLALFIAWKKSETFRNIVTGAFDKVKAAAGAVGRFFTEKIPAAFSKVIGWVKANWPKILAVLTGPIGLAVLFIARNWDKIKAGASRAKDWIVGKFTALVGFVRSLPGKISGAASGMWDGIKNAFKSAINWIIGKWNGLSFGIPSVDTHIKGIGKIGGFSLGTPDIPLLAKGGLLTEPTLNVAGEAGPEAVVPLDRLEGWIKSAASVGASNADARAYEKPESRDRRPRRSEFTITNWKTGEGFFREIAEDTYHGENEFAGSTRRMQ